MFIWTELHVAKIINGCISRLIETGIAWAIPDCPCTGSHTAPFPRAGLEDGTCRPEDVERAKAMVPPSLAPYIEQLARDGAGGELEAELETALHSGTATNSDRGGSITPSIDFDTDDDDEGLLEVDDEEEDD